MFEAFAVVQVVICVLLVIIILLQEGKKGMGAIFGGSSSSVFGARGAGNILTKITSVLAILFMINSVWMSYISSSDKSVVKVEQQAEKAPVQAPQAAQPVEEKKPEAVGLLRKNIDSFGLTNTEVISGSAPAACEDLPAPTHAFIGGSSGNVRDIVALLLAKNPQVTIVATAVSLETVAELNACLKAFDFTETDVVCLNAARARSAGDYNLMTAQNPVYIFTMKAL